MSFWCTTSQTGRPNNGLRGDGQKEEVGTLTWLFYCTIFFFFHYQAAFEKQRITSIFGLGQGFHNMAPWGLLNISNQSRNCLFYSVSHFHIRTRKPKRHPS